MATYECQSCGMSVNATCAKCNEPLMNDILIKDYGPEVQILKFTTGHKKLSHQCAVAQT